MTEVFKVGVTLTLNNLAGRVLGMINKQLMATDASAKALQKTMAIGFVVGGAGVLALNSLYKAGKEYEQAFARFKAMNLGEAMNQQADQFARSADVIGNSASDMMGNLRDLTQIMGDPKIAMQVAPFLAQMTYANKALFGESGMIFDHAQSQALEKINDMKGGFKNGDSFISLANKAEQVYAATGGMVRPSDYLQFMKTAGVSARLLDDKMFWYTTEPLIQEMGGGRVGTALMSAYNNLAQGRSTARSAQEMMKLGLLDPKNVEYDKIGQVKKIKPGALKGFDMFTSNPYEWMKETLIPALDKAGFKAEKDKLNEIGAILGNRTGSNLFSLMMLQQDKIEKNMRIAEHAMTVPEILENARKTPEGAEIALSASWERFKQELGRTVVPIVVPALDAFTNSLRKMGNFFYAHEGMAKALIKGIVVVTVGIVSAIFLGLTAVISPWIAIIAGGVMVVYSVYKLFGQIFDLFAVGWGYLKRFFDYLSEKMVSLGHWIGISGSNTPSVGAPPLQGPMQNGMVINMDGRKVGEIVSGHQAASARRPSSTGNDFDIRQSPLFAGSQWVGH